MRDAKVICVMVIGGDRGQNGLALPIFPVNCSQVLVPLQRALNWAAQHGHPVLPSLQCSGGLILNPVVSHVLIVGLMTPDFRSLIDHLSRQKVQHRYTVVTEACAWSAYAPQQLQDDLAQLRLNQIMKVVDTFEEARKLPQLAGV